MYVKDYGLDKFGKELYLRICSWLYNRLVSGGIGIKNYFFVLLYLGNWFF